MGLASVCAFLPAQLSAHTNSVGYLISSSSTTSCVNDSGQSTCYDVEVFFGTWHGGTTSAEGDLAIFEVSGGTETQVIGQSATGGSQVAFSMNHSKTATIPNPSGGSNPNYSATGTTAYTNLQSVFTLGTNYFFHDDSANTLVAAPNGNVNDVWAHQSAVAVGLGLGTYRVDYDAASIGMTATWDPQPAIATATFTIGSGGTLTVQGNFGNRDITQSDDIHTDLGNSSPTNATLNYVFDGGTLSVGANLSDNFSIKTGGGSVSVASGDDYTMSGVISDNGSANGSLTKVGAGTLRLSGTNTYTGATTVSAGTLQILSAGSVDGSSFTNNSSVNVYGDINVTGAVTNGSTFNLVGGTITAASGIANTGSINVSGSAGTITGDVVTSGSVGSMAIGTDLTVNGDLDNASTGAGVVSSGVNLGRMWTFENVTFNVSGTLTNRNRFYIRANSSVAANLADNKAAGTVSLQSGSTFTATTGFTNAGRVEGVGTIAGSLTSSGVVAPGNSPGTLTVAGDVTFTSTNTFDIDIDGRTYVAAGGSGTYDRLAITGASSTFTAGGAIAPITRNITSPATNTFTPIIGDAFRVVTTVNASGVSGTFASITQPTTGIPTNTRFDVVYGASYVDLVLTPDNLATFVTTNGGNQNTVRAATALQTVRPSAVAAKTGNSGAYWTGLYYLNAAQTLNALEQSSGQIHAYSLSAIRSSNVALARFDPAATLRADAEEALWVLVGGDWLNFSEDTIASGFDSVSRNVWVGADLHNTGDRRYGVAIGYSDSDVSTDGMGSAQTDTSSIMAYYFGETGNWNYSGLVSMGFSDITTQRTVDLSTGTTDNASDSSAKTHIARLTVGYSQPVSETVSVGFNADVLRMHTAASGFTETGSAVTGLSATQENQAETQASLSLGLNWAPQNTNTVMGFNAGVEVRPGHDRISDRDVTLHSASWEVETPYMDGQLRFLEAGFRTTVGDLFNTDFEDADAYRINGNVRYTHQGIYERTSLVLGISRAF